MARLGGMTYAVYLLHGSIGRDVYDAVYPRISALPLLLMETVAVLVCAYLLHVWFELGMVNRLKQRWMRSRQSPAYQDLPIS